ncbi:hypothetical protein FJR41_018370 [Dolichospermum planctonicum UHCC 0167]|jgi:hypothetical protein|uniref:hypothetical protein n=1 Tax=Dolichospermum planctonicum TaxID=136072 RepID=UPI0014432A93|nr:hypothetical protein [Dolichospermum planctonicum]MCW9682734.1 hypothetical protein [Dolichospermum planctonicum UHCC 0167]
MNSDLMPSSQSSNSTASKQGRKEISPSVNAHTLADQPSQLENSVIDLSKSDANGHLVNREQPIPPPSEPTQYRAIGLVRGCYHASSEQFTQGTLLTSDGVELNAVLLGRIMSLVKNHLDLEKEHLWVVYPRTRQENDALHLQIVGVWEPENLAKNALNEHSPDAITQKLHNSTVVCDDLKPSSAVPDGGFSVRGEVVYQSFDEKSLVVKIKQSPRKNTDKAKYFKLKLKGILTTKAVGKFWDFNVKRESDALVVINAEAIADLPKKRRPPFKAAPRGVANSGTRRPFPPRRNGEAPRPIRKTAGDPTVITKPIPKTPTPMPIKRPKPTGE